MIATTIPSEARIIADNIRDIAPELGHKILSSIISLFLLGKESLCQGVREMSFCPSVSTLSRSMRKISSTRLVRRMRSAVLKKMKGTDPKDWIFAIDDTSNPKYSKGLYRSDYWGSSAGVYMGQKIIVLVVINIKTKKCYPVGYGILPKRFSKHAPTAHWHAVRIVGEVLAAGFPPLTLVADSWFDSVSLMKRMEALDVKMVVQIKSNRRVRSNPGAYVPWLTLPEVFADIKRFRSRTNWESAKVRARKKRGMCLAEQVIQIRDRSAPVKVVAAYHRRNGNRVYGYFVSSDRTMPRAKVWAISRARWSIECFFRTCKQNLAFGKLSLGGKKAAHLAVVIPLFLYAKLTELCPKTLTLDRFIARIANESARKAIFNLTSQIDQRAAQVLRNRLATNRTHRKPCDKPAGDFQMTG